jgi:Domain of unknown function (DUF4421)
MSKVKLFFCIQVFFFYRIFAFAAEVSPLIGFGQESFKFTVGGIRENAKDIIFSPNITGITRFGLNAYGLGVGVSTRASKKDLDSAKGVTDFFDLQLGYHQSNWGIDSYYQVYEGFYTENTNQIQLYPDLKFIHYGLMTRIALDVGTFTVNGLMDQSDNITQTAGKYYFIGGARYHSMKSSMPLLQQEYVGTNTQLEALRQLESTSVNLGLGAGKYWVSASKFYIGALFDLIGTYGFYDYALSSSETTQAAEPTLSYNLKVGFGYSGTTFKTGFSVNSDNTTLKTPGESYIRPEALRTLYYIRFVF